MENLPQQILESRNSGRGKRWSKQGKGTCDDKERPPSAARGQLRGMAPFNPQGSATAKPAVRVRRGSGGEEGIPLIGKGC